MTVRSSLQCSDVGTLLCLGIVMYVGFGVLAPINANFKQCTLRRRFLSHPFTTSVAEPQFHQRFCMLPSNHPVHTAVFHLTLVLLVAFHIFASTTLTLLFQISGIPSKDLPKSFAEMRAATVISVQSYATNQTGDGRTLFSC